VASDYELADVLSEFARTMVTNFPIQMILDRLVERIVEIMPITGAGVTLISPDTDPRYIAASSESALRFEKLQTDLGEGPCLAAYRTGEAIAVPDLQDEARFPRFSPRAVDDGLRAVFTFPLRYDGRRLGALDLYRDTPGELTPDAMTAAQTLADVVAAYLLNAQARADLQASSDRSRQATLHDALTGLPNRVLVLERLEHAFRRGRRSGRTPAVIFVDLDHFKAVNDAHGHHVGDELLVAVAERLSGLLREGDTLARPSGDEFVIVCEDVGTPAQADAISARITAGMALPFVLSSVEVHATASVGIAVVDRAGVDPEQLLHDADLAMYRSKRSNEEPRDPSDRREEHLDDYQGGLERDLRGAMDRGELHIEYQPIVATVDATVTGVEALLRWTNPSRGPVPPSVLIPIAEEIGLINQIGEWVLERAWTARPRWHTQQTSDVLAMSVNVSARQFMSLGFTDTVSGVLSSGPDAPDLLTLEVTESVFVRDSKRALMVFQDLKALGVKIALDDFGTGYSSLSYLRQYPVDTVKIDLTFIEGLGRDATSETIVAAIIQLAHGFGIEVVAEGVESAVQHHILADLGCDSCQGFYFARPMAAESIAALIDIRADGTRQHLPALTLS
jgi:diguanylate cyclase (GGDEF)-like protein